MKRENTEIVRECSKGNWKGNIEGNNRGHLQMFCVKVISTQVSKGILAESLKVSLMVNLNGTLTGGIQVF